MTKTRALIALASSALLLAPAAAANAEAPEAGPYLQTADEALAQDLTLIAAAQGWTYAEALAQHKAAEAIGDLAVEVAAAYPDAFVGSALSTEPGGTPTLYIKGTAAPAINALAASAEVAVRIADDQPYSFVELEARSAKLHAELIGMGYDTLMTAVDITSGTVEAEIETTTELSSSRTSVRAALSEEFDEGVELNFIDSLDAGLEYAFGGARVNGDGSCTSGWTVITPRGAQGVTTAGHCDGMTRIYEDGTGWHAMDYRAQHRGQWGDVEWHSVPGQSTPARFYANASTRRTTSSIEPASGLTTGESICVYGRSTNERDCSALLLRPSIRCTIDGVSTDRLVQMNKHVTTDGDSGGGWSHGNRAYGGHVGHCSGDSVFTPVAYFPNALGVSVRTA
ncbi:hypothetical protein [Glycomyces algeriensis]|uniref:Serine protease n=1 Tax=Glycomyces algeriensis TaxID=256037 RepID=A0A9W6G7T7_9ACTN|nr:hypothetical protein [Glycomyces algeriensis]MDA1366080.1 hypothetical protein [Glycomyces algeriensis]MDR7349153.1 hypothetical protein [Glycomyces algeriensis]GLI41853.1 serine protease [Glycomyces algeriensis]